MLNALWKKGVDFLGVKHAILGGAMTWVSTPGLVSAISNAGAFGVLASGAMTPDLLDQTIQETKEKTSNPFGVNLILMSPCFEELLDVCSHHKVSHIVFAGGLPKTHAIIKTHSFGAKAIGFAATKNIAKRLVKMGLDALIIEGHEAGGHIGPVSTSVLAQEILPYINEIPIFVAGGIGRGEAIVAYLKMGAVGCQLGTRFVCTFESCAHIKFKEAFFRAESRDAMPSIQLDPRLPVIPVRSIANTATKQFYEIQKKMVELYELGQIELQEAQLNIEKFWAGSLKRAVMDGDVENGSLMAGQSVSFVTKEQSVQEVIDELLDQAHMFLKREFAKYPMP